MIKKKRIVAAVLMAILCTILGSCSENGVTSEAPTTSKPNVADVERTGTLKVWMGNPLVINYEDALKKDPSNGGALMTKRIVELFHEKYPKMELVIEDKGWADELRQKILLAQMSGQIPDLFAQEVLIPELAKKGVLAELDLSDISDKFVPNVLKTTTYNKKIYGVPIWTGVFGISYNKKLMIVAGLDPNNSPKTWDELYNYSKTIQGKNDNSKIGGMTIYGPDGTGGCIFRFLPFLIQNNGGILDENGKLILNSAQNIETFEYLRKLSKNTITNQVAMNNFTAILSLIHNNKTGFEIESSVSITFEKDMVEKNVGWASLPTKDANSKRKNVLVGTPSLCIFEKSLNKDIALNFAKIMVSEEIQKNVFETDQRIPVIKSVLENPDLIKGTPEMKPYIDDMLNAELYSFPVYEKNGAEITKELESMWKKIIQTNDSIETVVGTADTNIQALMK